MPKIALILSLVFSTYLIVRDCRRRRDVSIAIWIPTIFVMILSSRPASLWLSGRAARLGIENANEQATSMVDQLFYLISLGSAFVIASARGMKWGKLFSSNRAIMLFYLYFALSVLCLKRGEGFPFPVSPHRYPRSGRLLRCRLEGGTLL